MPREGAASLLPGALTGLGCSLAPPRTGPCAAPLSINRTPVRPLISVATVMMMMMATITVVVPYPRRDVLRFIFSIIAPPFLRTPACVVDCSLLAPFGMMITIIIIPPMSVPLIRGSCGPENGLVLSGPRSCPFVTGRRRLAPSFRRDSQCVCVHLSLPARD